MSSTKEPRPLSPHLQIYHPALTMLMSIAHRLTGGALYLGVAGVALWLSTLATGPQSWEAMQDFIQSIFGQLMLFGFFWALAHHMLGGLRHLLWDTGRGFGLKTIEYLAWGTLIGGFVLGVILWALSFFLMRGGA